MKINLYIVNGVTYFNINFLYCELYKKTKSDIICRFEKYILRSTRFSYLCSSTNYFNMILCMFLE
jgi:hypothetical protein